MREASRGRGIEQQRVNARRRRGAAAATRSIFLLLVALTLTNCRSSGAKQTAARPPVSDFARKLDYVRRGQYMLVYVFRRKDNAPFQSDDKAYLKANAPRDTNMWVLTDDGTAALAGSNFQFTTEQLQALNQRFALEDYSGR